jgi:hypothetical protein
VRPFFLTPQKFITAFAHVSRALVFLNAAHKKCISEECIQRPIKAQKTLRHWLNASPHSKH